ncbi:MAG: condensation domain-containing protein [Burkholderiales bacterium]
MDKQLAYWKGQLAGDLPRLDLPLDAAIARAPERISYLTAAARSEVVAENDYAGGRVALPLSEELTAALKALSRRERVTQFMTMLASFQLLLSRYSGQVDVLLGTPIAGRNRVETEPLIGFFIGTLVLRANLAGVASFRELLHRTSKTALDAYENQDVPFEKLVEELQPERQIGRNPLFDVLINYAPAAQLDLLQIDGIEATQLFAGDAQSKFG